jgi:DNA-binding MarR family transcriptional regulator
MASSTTPPALPAEWEAVLPAGVEPSVLLVTLWLNRLGRLFEVSLEAMVREHGLVASELRVLGTLLLAGPPYELSPTRLNDIVVLSSGGMTKAVARLVDLGLVERRADPADGRGVLVRLTRSGRRRATELLGALTRDVQDRLAPLGPERRAVAAAVLGDLLGAFRDPGSPVPEN